MAAERAAGSSPQASNAGALHRLVRTLSGKASSQSAAHPISPVLSSGTIPPSISEAHDGLAVTSSSRGSTSTNVQSSQKDLLAAVIDRFKNFNFGLGKFSTSSASDGPQESQDASPNTTSTAPANILLETSGDAADAQAEPFPSGPAEVDAVDQDESTYLARKIQALIDSLPLPSSPRTPIPPKQPKPPARDRSGRPIPPPGATPIKDSKLIAMLSSATIMNGGRAGAGERERRVSVWSVLESLGSARADDGDDVENGPGDGEGDGEGTGDGDGGSVFQDTSGIMMYSPLFPTNESLVEIADSGLIEPPPAEEGGNSAAAAQFAGLMGMWPFSIWSSDSTSGSTLVPAVSAPTSSPPSLTTLPVSPVGSPRPPGSPSLPGSPRIARLRIQGQRVWVPSTTKLSFQAMWWGYRLYLPPPVVDILDDKQIEATKRAAMITTALTWFFSNIPLTALPPAVRPAVLLLQTLIPYVGYIGTFISWSWGTIKSYDTGHGVILTATWLLPVALIPGTWQAEEFPPASPPEQGPTPLPPTSPPPVSSPSLPTSPTPAPPSSPPPSSPPISPAPTPSDPRIPVQLPPSSPPPSSPLPPRSPAPPTQEPTPPTSPPTSPRPELPQASEPLPPWVLPPPPPSPPKIPLPEIGPDEPLPRFGFGALGKGRSRDRDGERKREKGRGKERDGKKDGKDRAKRFKAIVSSPFMGSRSQSGGASAGGA
ncbi:hypothetical protein FPV67DRAFT_1779390 [Lyophyllum atratum]|nr:hypothetical protein FPV67DRAFT_1779390 [Lyophyllum atratum]